MPIMAGIAFFWLPESPKFLMSRGRNEEAMVIFKRIYTLNTGRPADEFPVSLFDCRHEIFPDYSVLELGWGSGIVVKHST